MRREGATGAGSIEQRLAHSIVMPCPVYSAGGTAIARQVGSCTLCQTAASVAVYVDCARLREVQTESIVTASLKHGARYQGLAGHERWPF